MRRSGCRNLLMTWKMILATLALAWFAWSGVSRAAEAGQGEWLIDRRDAASEIEIDPQSGLVTATGGVTVRYRGADSNREAVLIADRATVDQQAGIARAEGTVSLQSAGMLWRGDRLVYHFRDGRIEGDNFRSGHLPFFIAGSGLAGDPTNKVYSARNVFLTGDDVAEPNYRIKASSLVIHPGEGFEARDAVAYLGDVPVMWFPFYSRSFSRHPNNFEFTPGYRSRYGPYLLGTYNWYYSTNLEGAVHADWRQRRGVAGGPELTYDLGRFGTGHGLFYYGRDEDPGLTPTHAAIRDHRHRVDFWHRIDWDTNTVAKVVVHDQSDPYYLRDFFEQEYRRNTQPASFFEFTRNNANWSLDVLAQKRVDDFWETVERLPDVKLSGSPQQLGASPFFYESDSSVGYFQHTYPTGLSNDFSAFRADSYHQLTLPRTFFGFLNVVPRVGGRFTHYGETEGYSTVLTSQDRWVLNTGAEISWKAARTWKGARNELLEVQGIRHIIEPSFNYVYVPRPDVLPRELPQFDSELPTLRLRPIQFPDYNTIDSIDSQNVLRVALRNKVQTRRRDGVQNLVNWAFYTDWHLRPRAGQSTFADLFSDLDFRPRNWLTFNSEVRYDTAETRFREANHTVTLNPGDRWSWTLGHRYLHDDLTPQGYGLGNNLIISSYYLRLNENWAVRLSHHFEARDGTMEEQYYTLYRDFRSWTGALTLRVRDHRGVQPQDVTVAFTLSLKAFPRFKVGSDRNDPSYLLGL